MNVSDKALTIKTASFSLQHSVNATITALQDDDRDRIDCNNCCRNCNESAKPVAQEVKTTDESESNSQSESNTDGNGRGWVQRLKGFWD